MAGLAAAAAFAAVLFVFLGAASLAETAPGSGASLRSRLDALRGLGPPVGEEGGFGAPRGTSLSAAARAAVSRALDRLQPHARRLATEEIEQRLLWAGLSLPPDRFAAARLLCTGALSLLLAAAGGALSGLAVAALPLGLVGAGLGWLLPDLWLDQRLRRRQAEMSRELPMFVDLLSTATQAGLPLDEALRVVGRQSSGVLAQTFLKALRAREAGQTLEAALEWAASRLGNRDVESIARTIAQARQYGTPVSQVLSEIGDAVRRERVERARERAGRTGTLVILPVALFILPVTVVILAYPALVSVLHSLLATG